MTEGTILDVDLTNADSSEISANPNAATTVITATYTNPAQLIASGTPTTYTVEAGTITETKKITATYYLQHGQSIKIQGIPDGAAYTMTEVQEDYTPTANITGDKTKSDSSTVELSISADNKSASVADDGLTNDTTVTFTNNRNGVIPTGILISIAPAAIVGLIVAGGIVFLCIRNKKRKSEEE